MLCFVFQFASFFSLSLSFCPHPLHYNIAYFYFVVVVNFGFWLSCLQHTGQLKIYYLGGGREVIHVNRPTLSQAYFNMCLFKIRSMTHSYLDSLEILCTWYILQIIYYSEVSPYDIVLKGTCIILFYPSLVKYPCLLLHLLYCHEINFSRGISPLWIALFHFNSGVIYNCQDLCVCVWRPSTIRS